MADTTFVDYQTVVPAAWLNDVNRLVYKNEPAKVVVSIAELKTLDKTKEQEAFATGYYTQGDGGGGSFWYDSTDTISVDNGVTVIVALDGGRWKLAHNGALSVKQGGAKGDGVTDDASAIQAVLNACPQRGTVIFPAGNYVIGAQLNLNTDYLTLIGPGKLTAKSATNFEHMLLGVNRTGCLVRDLEFDANKAGRATGQTIRFCGATFSSCTDCTFINVTVYNTRGFSSIPGVGITLGGASVRCKIDSCKVIDCGDASPNASDGIYTSGTQNLITDSIAVNCTDTAFVIEKSDFCGIASCTSLNCSAGAAITGSDNQDRRGNYIDGITIRNWRATNTGGIQIGVPNAGTGNLLDTMISCADISADTAGGFGVGAAINIRQLGAGRAIGVTINGVRINGATTQGILVDGDDVTITGCNIKGTTSGCIQFQSGTVDGFAGNNYLRGGQFGVVTNGTASAIAQGNVCRSQTSHGIFALATSTMRSIFNTVLNPTVGYESKDAGATLILIGHRDGFPAYNLHTAGAPVGVLNKRISTYDNTGTPTGALGIYS